MAVHAEALDAEEVLGPRCRLEPLHGELSVLGFGRCRLREGARRHQRESRGAQEREVQRAYRSHQSSFRQTWFRRSLQSNDGSRATSGASRVPRSTMVARIALLPQGSPAPRPLIAPETVRGPTKPPLPGATCCPMALLDHTAGHETSPVLAGPQGPDRSNPLPTRAGRARRNDADADPVAVLGQAQSLERSAPGVLRGPAASLVLASSVAAAQPTPAKPPAPAPASRRPPPPSPPPAARAQGARQGDAAKADQTGDAPPARREEPPRPRPRPPSQPRTDEPLMPPDPATSGATGAGAAGTITVAPAAPAPTTPLPAPPRRRRDA